MGKVGERISVRLRIADGLITVEASPSQSLWTSGGGQRSYSVIGSWNDWKPLPMYKVIGDVFKCVVDLPVQRAYGSEEFKIIVDQDPSLGYYPAEPHAVSG